MLLYILNTCSLILGWPVLSRSVVTALLLQIWTPVFTVPCMAQSLKHAGWLNQLVTIWIISFVLDDWTLSLTVLLFTPKKMEEILWWQGTVLPKSALLNYLYSLTSFGIWVSLFGWSQPNQKVLHHYNHDLMTTRCRPEKLFCEQLNWATILILAFAFACFPRICVNFFSLRSVSQCLKSVCTEYYRIHH